MTRVEDIATPALQTFTADHLAELGGPHWLARRRPGALERFVAGAMPTERDEDWRYSRIDELELDRFSPHAAANEAGGVPAAIESVLHDIGPRAALLVVANGRIAVAEVDPGVAQQGVTIAPAGEEDEAASAGPAHAVDAMSHLHDAFVAEVAVVRIPRGVVVDQPIVVIQWADPGSPNGAVFPHVVVDAGEQSEATVVSWSSSTADPVLTVPVTELVVGDAANLRYVAVQNLGAAAWQLGYLFSRTGRDANLSEHVVALGGDYARLWVDAALPGQGSSTRITGVYFGNGTRMHDFRSVQLHDAPRAMSDFLLKGAVVDRARGVYSGVIRVVQGAKGTDAFLTNRNLVLSDGARVDSVPNLDIENENDLKSCGHAAATGPVDEEQLFYLESRGVPTAAAERLIVHGFFDEVLARLPVPGLRPRLREAVSERLEGSSP